MGLVTLGSRRVADQPQQSATLSADLTNCATVKSAAFATSTSLFPGRVHPSSSSPVVSSSHTSAACPFTTTAWARPPRLRDASIRPNQLFALSLPFTLLEGEQAERVLRVCEEQLLTPVGLRTLAPSDPRYRGRMTGPPDERDAAYHQGTVWPWLIGSYVDAVIRVRGPLDPSTLLAGLRAHLAEAGIGTISEVFDGDAPHTPRGCIAQAWSVGEMLRVCAR